MATAALENLAGEAAIIAPAQTENGRFAVKTLVDAFKPRPPRDWLVEDIFCAGSLDILAGDPGCKKTWTALWLAFCIAIGTPFLGHTTKQGRVLFVDEESGEDRLTERLRYVARGIGADENAPIDYLSIAQFDLLHSEDDKAMFCEIAINGRYSLIVVDALADIMPGGKENTVEDTQPIARVLRSITSKTGAVALLLHHTGKNGDIRGSSGIVAACDVAIKMVSEQDSVTLRSSKNRDGAPFVLNAMCDFEPEGFIMSETMLTVAEKKQLNRSQEYVVRFLTEHGASRKGDIMGAADVCSSDAAENAIYSLKSKGLIHRINPDETGRGVQAIFALKEQKDDN